MCWLLLNYIFSKNGRPKIHNKCNNGTIQKSNRTTTTKCTNVGVSCGRFWLSFLFDLGISVIKLNEDKKFFENFKNLVKFHSKKALLMPGQKKGWNKKSGFLRDFYYSPATLFWVLKIKGQLFLQPTPPYSYEKHIQKKN